MAIYDRIRARTKDQFWGRDESAPVSRRSGNDNGDRRSSKRAPCRAAARPSHLHDDREILPTGALASRSSRLCRRHAWSGSRSMNIFHTPTSKAFDELVRDQKLNGLQAHELRLVLYHLDEDLKDIARGARVGRPGENRSGASKESLSRLVTWSLICVAGGRRSTTSCLRTRGRKSACSCPSVRWSLHSREKFKRPSLGQRS
jgi:hypothetical protein